ncbi:uncharacterized, partial [Tachysurus ichikawai]
VRSKVPLTDLYNKRQNFYHGQPQLFCCFYCLISTESLNQARQKDLIGISEANSADS